MPRAKISEFSTTAGDNTDIDGINIAEGCAPSGINDAIRELMAQLKDFQSGAAGDNITVVGTLAAKGTSSSGADLKLYEDTDNGTNYVGFIAPASIASNVQWTLPSADGSSGQALQTNGSGTLSFATLGISAGGTGQTTANAAFNALAPSQTSNAGRYLKTDGTNTSWDLLDISTADITGTLPVANGGTGITSFGTGVATALGINVGSSGAFVVNGGALGTPSSGTVTNLTGTASININGTVGATTPNTGSFTTLTTSSTVTINGGTANGVAYLNGSKVLTTGSALTFDGTNLGLGGAPVAVGSSPVLEIYSGANNGILKFTNSTTGTTNSDGTWLYQPAGSNNFIVQNQESAGDLRLFSTTHIWGNHNYSTEYMRLTSTGLGIGTSSPGAKLEVANTSGSVAARLRSSDSGYSELYFADVSDNAAGALSYEHSSNMLRLYNGGAARVYLDSSGNLGLGVTPSAWDTIKPIEIARAGSFVGANSSGSSYLGVNARYQSGWKYANNGAAGLYTVEDNTHFWRIAPSGTAGNAISFTQAMTLDASSRLGIKQTSPTVDLDVGANDNTVAALSVRYSTVPAYLSNSFDGSVGLTTLSANSYNTSSGSASWSAFQNTGYGNAAVQLAVSTGGADIRFLTAAAANTTPTERARIPSAGGFQCVNSISVGNATPTTSGAGITFPATQSASSNANTLDDYERGTWTPAVSGLNGGALTLVAKGAQYTKIGNVVHVFWEQIEWTANSGLSGNVQITGLPFASRSSFRSSTGGFGGSSVGSLTFTGVLQPAMDANTSNVWIIYKDPTNNTYSHTPTFASTGIIYGFSLTYLAAN